VVFPKRPRRLFLLEDLAQEKRGDYYIDMIFFGDFIVSYRGQQFTRRV
jgi:hypothetical protein